jgi:SAM-dependent methyltransferase
LKIESIELGSHPFRGEGIVGLVSTFLDPLVTGPALDIGCGQGKYLPLLASQCKSVVAADLSAGMLADVPDGPWEKMIADVESMTFADGSFDVVLANHMLYHCPEIETAVAELRRVLRVDNGVLIATTNGNGNMAEAYELLASAASSVMGESVEPLQPADARFTLETGSEALGKLFDSVTVHRTVGTLVINDAVSLDALRSYFRSADDEWSFRYSIDWPVLEVALDAELHRALAKEGEIRISTVSGVLFSK